MAKLAEVVPSFKKDDNLQVKNYRPISILPVLSKIIERLMLNQMTPFLDNILHPRIAAYRVGYSCQTVLLRLVEDWKQAAEKKHQVGAVMDLSKAFDCLSHQLIIAKFHAYGANVRSCALIWSYLHNTKQRVRINGQTSTWKTLLKGVPQGSIMGPVLFNLFVNDIVHVFQKSSLYNYADDNTICVSGTNRDIIIQTLAGETQEAIKWFQDNMMEANPQKFQALFLKSGKTENDFCNIEINDFVVKSETSV
jgi:retron-type reverse transcriptase